jgi:hypothetical protein
MRIRKSRSAETFAGLQMGAINEFGGGNAFTSFLFNAYNAQNRCVSASDE